MTGTTSKSELEDRIAELEQRISDLEDRVVSGGGSSSTSELLDRYDRYVVDRVERVESAPPRKLMRLYEEAGVVDTAKQKRRAKRLPKVVGDNE